MARRSTRGRTWTAAALIAGALAAGCGDDDGPAPVNYALVTVGDPGNAADDSGYGSVPYAFRIGRHEVTIGQYAAFLDAVAASDPHELYHPAMGGNGNVAGIVRGGSDGAFTYAATGPSGSAPPGAASAGERPITYVSWFSAARFANWMANGQPRGAQDEASTEDGAYTLTGAVGGDAIARNAINPHTGAPPTFYLPTENEWYKAAFYSPARDGGTGGYFALATQSDDAPGNRLGGDANQVNYITDGTGASIYSVTQQFDLLAGQNYLNEVGAFTASASFYGAFDLNGNVWEWNDLDARSGPYRIQRGGGWTSTLPYLQSSLRLGNAPDGASSNGGFRLAAPAPGSTAPAVSAAAAASDPPPALASAPTVAGDLVSMAMVEVGDAGNPDDTTGFGGVAHDFRIATFPVTIGQYTAFLNAVAAADPYRLYHPRMAEDAAIAGIGRAGSDGSHTYAVLDNGGDSADRPITYVSWWDAARFANWMANGQPSGAPDATTTEDGAYPVAGATDGPAVVRRAINPNTGAPPAFVMPLEDEWYKAAYYDPTRDGGGYWNYATRSDDTPGNAVGDAPNQVNYFAGTFTVTGGAAQEPNQHYLTDVGAFTASASAYGTFDQNGSVWQWNDLDGTANASRGMRGGYWFSGSLALQSAVFCNDGTARESNDVGFRLAGPASN